MSIFTAQQTEALDTGRHLLVTANAGAGKTTVLVRRFAEIILSGKAKVHEIVAITYTEKAAGELRKKIADFIEGLLEHPDIAHNPHALLNAVRNQLSSATIGTIHSFCSQILREYPVEADVDAAFTVLEGPDQQSLIHDSLRETFEKLMQSVNDDERKAFTDALRMLGKTAVQKYLTFFLINREKMERLIGSGGLYESGNDDSRLLSSWSMIVEETVLGVLGNTRYLDALFNIIESSNGKRALQVKQKLHELKSLTARHDRFSAVVELISIFFTKDSKIRKEVSGSGLDESVLRQEIAFVCELHKSLTNLVDAVRDENGAEGNQTLLRMTRTLLSVYLKASATYEEKKQELGLLDFEDLQLKARDLLRNSEIRKKISEKFAFIMVDEFQDTNRLQYEILTLLVANYQRGNLFVVGDPKQSIYGFRNAEVEMFEKAKGDILGDGHSSGGKEVTLAESFRPLLNVALFVNLVFSRAMGVEQSFHAIPYTDIVKGRLNTAEGKVELLMVRDDSDESPESNKKPVTTECAMIARRILECVHKKEVIFDGHGEHPRPMTFRDVAILLRNRKHVSEIEHVLSVSRIPYRLTGGIGFYQTQEVFDLLNYFLFLLNRDDDVALAGILRSPFFSIPDAELFEISAEIHEGTFWEKVVRYSEQHPEKKPVQAAITLLREDILLANRVSVPILVQRIFQKTGWRGSVAAFDHGEQHASNIQKLLSLARDFESRGLHTLFDFVQRLQSLVKNEPREGQATVDLHDDCVQVMTIHSAKGLEFPVVFLPFTHEPFRYDINPLIDTEIGVGFGVRQQQNLDEEISAPLYELLRYRNKVKVDAEEKRIFYVGATRARDMLVLSGQMSAKTKKASYLQWTLDAMNVDRKLFDTGVQSFPNQPLTVLRKKGDTFFSETITHTLDVHIQAHETPEIRPYIPERNAVPERLGQVHFVYPLHGKKQGEFFSATQIKTFLECPTKYYLKYLLGLPEMSAVPYDFHEEEEPSDEIRGEMEGSLTHAVLQNIHYGNVSEEEVGSIVMQMVSAGGSRFLTHYTSLVDVVTRNVMNFISSSFGKEVLAAVESRTEFSLNAIFHEDYLTGIIDRLYKTPDGNWHVLDYKTDRVSSDQMQERALFHRPQLAMYAFLVHRWFKQKEVRATLIFLRHTSAPCHFDFTSKDFESFENEIRSVIGKIKQNNFERLSRVCESCTYKRKDDCLVPSKYTPKVNVI